MEEFNAYYFPWVRKGLGTYIDETDSLGENDGVVLCRPELTVKSKYTVQHERPEEGKKDNESEIILEKTVKFTGPGDILRVNASAVMKVHPEAGSEGFPTQYLPYIEFWEPDFLWRYTPASENDGRLRPWMALLVCPKDLVRIGTLSGDMSYFTFIGDEADWGNVFPDVKLLHRSAHAQGNEPDKADFCRLLGMRNQELLEKNVDYVALLVPAYETGRLRGLGLEEEQICDVPAQQTAWEATMAEQKKKRQGLEFPIYYKWFFKAGTDDFDTIAARLEPVGEQLKAGLVLDVTDMGEGFSYKTVAHEKSRFSIMMPAATLTPGYKAEVEFPANGVAKYQTEEKLYTNLKNLLSKNPVFAENRANIQGNDAVDEIGTDDPMIVPPVYGARHAMATELDEQSAPWLKELNMDVHHRAAAGLGRKVVQKHQEELMDRAWKQVEAIQALNMELYQRLMSINANKALQKKSLDLFVDEQDPSKFLGYFMRYLATMKSAAGENAPSMEDIISNAGIPASFAAPSFQQNTEKLAKIVADLDTSTLMENIVDKQLFKFTQQEPVGAVSLDDEFEISTPSETWSLLQKNMYYQNALLVGAYEQHLSDLVFMDLTKETDEHFGSYYRPAFDQKRLNLITRQPISNSYAIEMPLEPYRYLMQSVSSFCEREGKDDPDTFKAALEAFMKEKRPYYTRLYVVDDEICKRIDEDKHPAHRTIGLKETSDGLEYTGVGDKRIFPPMALFIPDETYDLLFGEDGFPDGARPEEGNYVYTCPHLEASHNHGLRYKYHYPIGPDCNLEEETFLFSNSYNHRVLKKEGVMADEITAEKAIFKYIKETIKESEGHKIHDIMRSFFSRFRNYDKTEYKNVLEEDWFKSKVLDGALLFYKEEHPTIVYNGVQSFYKNCEKLFNYLITGDDTLYDVSSISDLRKQYFLTVLLYQLTEQPAVELLASWWRRILGRNTLLYTLSCHETIGPWMLVLLLHIEGSTGYYSKMSKILKEVDDFLMSSPAYLLVTKSRWNSRKIPDVIDGGLEGVVLKTVKEKLFPEEQAYLEKSRERLVNLHKMKVKRTPTPVDPVPIDNKAVTELKESMENKDAVEQMRKVAQTYYDHFYADNEEGKRLRAEYIDKLLMSKYPILAYPFFPEPTYYYLNMISDKFIIPGLDQIPMDHIAMFTSNPQFTEAFLCGMNTEMGSELQWREYPTDRRGSYFRKFWDSESSAEAIRNNEFFDVEPLHLWEGTHLGENHLAGKGNLLIFAIHSDLFKLYPNTHVFLNKAVQGASESQVAFGSGRLDPVMETFIRENILLVGFDISLKEALGAPRSENCGYLLAFEQDLDDLNFTAQAKGLDRCKTSAETANLLKDKVTIFGKHISRFMDAN